MRRSYTITCFAMLFGLGLFACDNSSSDEPTLVGDWFDCENTACTSFGDDALRFTEDGEFRFLDFEDEVVDLEQPFCVFENRGRGGLYVFDGRILKLSGGRDSPLSFDVELSGNTLRATPIGGSDGPSMLRLRRLRTKEEGCKRPSSSGNSSPPVGMPTVPSGPVVPSPPTGNGPTIPGHPGPKSDSGTPPPDAGRGDSGADAGRWDSGADAGATGDSGMADAGATKVEGGVPDSGAADATAL